MAGPQSVVRFDQAFGVVGEMDMTGPHRVEPGTINSPTPANNVIGRLFTQNAAGVWRAGDPDTSGLRSAILGFPKEHALRGDGVETLNPSMTLPNNAQGQFMTMGFIVIALPAVIALGSRLIYDQATGIISGLANGASVPAGSALVPNGYVDRFAATTGQLVVRARLTN